MTFKSVFLLSCVVFLIQACSSSKLHPFDSKDNPAAEGFNFEKSDPMAIKIADQVMNSMGGRRAWDQTRYIQWNFFGRRSLVWDKKEELCRIEIPSDSLIMLVDLDMVSGRVKRGKMEYSNKDSISYYLQRAKEIWINDSYWLVMPYKLKDSGVKLKYQAIDTTSDGRRAHVLELSFENVGVTPQNKYRVYVDYEKLLVTQWDYYGNFSDESPRFTTPWLDYRKYGNILLSSDRGRSKLSDVRVLERVDPKFFTEF